MIIGIPKEAAPGETRVAAVPETVGRMKADGLEVVVESGAGQAALFSDEQYAKAGASIAESASSLYANADVVVKVNAPRPDQPDEISVLRRGSCLICLLEPRTEHERLQRLASAGVTAFALDSVPRISRAQSMDVLSSMASLAGYKAVLLAANELIRLMPMMMTAAGTIKPAHALVIGAGVAGLQAIATLRRLGAVIAAADVRPAVEEEVASLGAKFVPMKVEHAEAQTQGGYAADLGEDFYKQEQDILRPHVKTAAVVICTALVPGRRAPVLITDDMLAEMAPGSVVVDLAAAAGGNCTRSEPDQRVEHEGVVILGPTNLPATMPADASLMFARNAARFCKELIADAKLNIDVENEVIAGMLATHGGKVVFGKAPEAVKPPEPQPEPESAKEPEAAEESALEAEDQEPSAEKGSTPDEQDQDKEGQS